jgi:superfamily II DNA helicase RecQ
MRDQLDRLPEGLPGAMLWGGQTRSEADVVIQDAARGALKLLYIAPEKLLTPVVLQALLRLPQGIGLVRLLPDVPIADGDETEALACI